MESVVVVHDCGSEWGLRCGGVLGGSRVGRRELLLRGEAIDGRQVLRQTKGGPCR